MKKILCLFLTMLALSACGKSSSNSSDETKATPQGFAVMPEPFANAGADTGGDEDLQYYDAYSFKISSLDMSFESLVNEDDVAEWIGKTNPVDNGNVNIREIFGLYSFIIHFEIPDDTVRDILVKQREFYISQEIGSEYYLTDKEIDILLSKDDKAVAKYFVSENAIEKDGKIYSPKWIYTHSIEDYQNEGISAEVINEKVEKFVDDIPFTDDAKKALKEKNKAYSESGKNSTK